jgi:hypothetical protein
MNTRESERSEPITGQCLCGAVRIEIGCPARWAWHDHTRASRIAHGAAYATYVGSWRKRFRIVEGDEDVTRYEDRTTRTTRGFCRHCGAPVFYLRAHSPHMVNVPRALFDQRTGREPRYHVGIDELREWTYAGEPLTPLKGFPGIVWERPKKSKQRRRDGMF